MHNFDVIVVGAGHAGCEAALSSARMGAKTAIFTITLDNIGVMSCNPSIGGPAKSHLVKEIDALGGGMGRNIDKTFVQIRVLNTKKGPAVRALRAQADKVKYAKEMKKTLENCPNLSTIQGMVTDLVIEDGKVIGVKIREGVEYRAKMVILATGTFMRGLIHIGQNHFSGGRMGELSSDDLPLSLEKAGIKLGRFKTGTPSRIDARTIDFSKVEDAINAVNRDKDITEQEVVNSYAKAINEAIDQLEYKAADYTEVDKAIEKANKLNKDNYKDFSKVEDAIKTVVRSKNITEQDEVDAMAKAINDAIDALVFQLKIKYDSNGGTGTMANPTVELDKEFIFQKCEYVAPNGKHFKGWQVDNTVYKVGDKRVFTKDDQNKEIKAVWEEHTFDQKLKEVNGVSTLKDKATCTTNAIYYKSCACGQVSTTETFEDKDTKLGHEYTKQIKDAKYLKYQGSNGQEHDAYWYACSRCDVSAKDDENAQDKYYESAEVGNHVLSKDWNKDSNNHWHSCTVPGCNEVSDKGNHVYDQEVESSEYLATPATCMTPARYYKSCICGAKGTEAFAATGTHLGHAYIEVKNPQFLREKATNCKEHDTYWYVCSRCGKTSKTINKYYEDKDSKGEHISSDWIIDQQPTVAKEGSKHKECTVCKEVLETEKIAKLENVKTETKKEETASKKEIKVESKKAVITGDNTNSIVPIVLLGISLLGIYMIVMKKCVR